MHMTRRLAIGGLALAGAVQPRAFAQAPRPIRLGVLNDQSGPYRDGGGPTSTACVRQAVLEFGTGAFPVEVLVGDHQNKPDIGAGLARQWLDRDGVDAIVDVPSSAVALAVNTVVKERNKVYLNCGAATTELTGAQCTPNTVHWTYDTTMLASSAGSKSAGTKWFFITADYVFGQEMQAGITRVIQKDGGSIAGSVRYPFPGTSDFSSYLLQAQASGATVLGLVNAGSDTLNCIKQAHEFGLNTQLRLVAMLLFITDVNGLGLETAQGLTLTESFYWDLNDGTRAFTKRLIANQKPPNYPDMETAGCYASVLHYLKAVAKVGVPAAQADGATVVAAMKAQPAEDDAFGRSVIRPDGRQISPAYLFQVKSPAESKGAWDYFKLSGTTSGEAAYGPVNAACALVKG